MYKKFRIELMELWKNLYRGVNELEIKNTLEKHFLKIDKAYHKDYTLNESEMSELIKIVQGISADLNEGIDVGTYTEEELEKHFK